MVIEKKVKKRVKDIPLGPLAPIALDSSPGARSGWSPFIAKRKEFPPPHHPRTMELPC